MTEGGPLRPDEFEHLRDISEKVMLVADEEAQKFAALEIGKYIRSRLNEFDGAAGGELEMTVFYDLNFAGYQVEAKFTFNGYRYIAGVMIREEDAERALASVPKWQSFLNARARDIATRLRADLEAKGITQLVPKETVPVDRSGWFEAGKNPQQPRRAPKGVEIGTIWRDIFGQEWVKVTENEWVTKQEHDAIVALHRVPTLAELEREANRVTQEELEAAEQTVLASMAAMGVLPEKDSPCLSGCRPSEGDVCGGPRCT
jgi:hypothetical protein